ncbi:class I adenylate-forming enzyme family protein [Actinophytocola sediminis]
MTGAAVAGGIDFTTSGSTGPPTVWRRTREQLRAEVELVVDTVLGPVEHVVSFAPRRHLYGALFAEVLPELLDVGVDDLSGDPLAVPRIVPGRRTLYVCLPGSWPILRAAGGDLRGSYALHGAGPVPPGAAAAVATLGAAGLVAVELFGSTETGAIAHRPMAGGADEPWRLFRDVTLLDTPGPDGSCALHVQSPRIARQDGPPAGSHRLDDLIRPVGRDGFRFLGRAGRLIKINGRRCDLGRIERVVAEAVPGLDALCVGMPDPVRGEHYELFVAGPALDPGVLAGALGELPAPRAVHRLDRIPRTATGKAAIDQRPEAAR